MKRQHSASLVVLIESADEEDIKVGEIFNNYASGDELPIILGVQEAISWTFPKKERKKENLRQQGKV